jgi:hypothetical protein
MDKHAPLRINVDIGSFGAEEAYYARSEGKTAAWVPPALDGILL